jgi:hypothetical protein
MLIFSLKHQIREKILFADKESHKLAFSKTLLSKNSVKLSKSQISSEDIP